MTKPIQLFGLGLQGRSPNVTSQLRTNLYAEIAYEGDKSRVSYYPTPGSTLLASIGASPARGMHVASISEYLYPIAYSTFYRVDAAGTVESKGTLTTVAGNVCMADDGLEVLIVDGTDGYYYDLTTGAFTTIVDADFPAGASSCAFLSGRMIVNVPNSGSFAWSDLYAKTWPALNTATAESSPDKLVRVYVNGGQLMLLGETTLEWWGTTSDANLPYAPIQGAVSEWGLAAQWSICKFGDSSVAFLGRNRLGQVQVVRVDGYQVRPISLPDLDYTINNYSAVEDATATSFLWNGHPMYEISFPTANATWLYDAASESWSKVTTGTLGRHIAQWGANFRNKVRISDYSNGNIYTLEPTAYTDNGVMIRRSIIGRHVFQGDPMSISEMWIDMEMGVGLPNGQGSDPLVILRTSKDGGHTWSNELFSGIGAQGVYQRRAVFRRLGRARDWLFEVSIADPVKPVVIGAWMEASL